MASRFRGEGEGAEIVRKAAFSSQALAGMEPEGVHPMRLPKDVRDSLPPALLQRPRVYARDLGQERMRDLRRRFWEAIQPLHRAGKLGVVLFQFPVKAQRGCASDRRGLLEELRRSLASIVEGRWLIAILGARLDRKT